MDINSLLPRLARVKKSSGGGYLARCPAHSDKTPSLSVKQCADGKILMHCFSGCTPLQVLDSIGLKVQDLFPDDPLQFHREERSGPTSEAVEWAAQIEAIANYDERMDRENSEPDQAVISKARDILDQVPTPPKPNGKPKLPPFAKVLADRQRYKNIPFMVVITVGIDAWKRAEGWSGSENDIIGIVLPDGWSECYIWPVEGCTVLIERDLTPGDDVISNLVKCLLIAGAWRVVVQPVGGEFENIYCGVKEVSDVA